jgi:hypothetical protein
MLENFKDWWIRNNHEIAWFLIGYLVSDGLYQLGRGNNVGALIDFGFAFINYMFNKR